MRTSFLTICWIIGMSLVLSAQTPAELKRDAEAALDKQNQEKNPCELLDQKGLDKKAKKSLGAACTAWADAARAKALGSLPVAAAPIGIAPDNQAVIVSTERVQYDAYGRIIAREASHDADKHDENMKHEDVNLEKAKHPGAIVCHWWGCPIPIYYGSGYYGGYSSSYYYSNSYPVSGGGGVASQGRSWATQSR